uniref:Ras-related protein Rab-24 n=1 Tax=Oncorhynchus tshawytscha TaxID=74940 RepID=A0A8C8FEJ2_ONCTS
MTMRVDAKVVMLGKESVGKTSLVERYVHHRFLVGPYQNTIGAAFVAKPIQVGDKVVTLGIWDTAGSERYEAMSRIYYRGARAAIVCYDLTDTSSFQRARFWVKELQNCDKVTDYLIKTQLTCQWELYDGYCHIQCIWKVFRPLDFFNCNFFYITALFKTVLHTFSPSSIYTQYPIMTPQKQVFRNVFKWIKKKKDALFKLVF